MAAILRNFKLPYLGNGLAVSQKFAKMMHNAYVN